MKDVKLSRKDHGDCIILQSKDNLQSHKTLCENKDSFNIIMSSEDTKTLQFNQYQKIGQAPFIIYEDLECIIDD